MAGSPVTKLAVDPDTAFDEAGGYLDIVVSVEVPDRDDEVVVPSTIRLDAYRANPVVLFAHDQKALPIAKCESPDGRFTCRLDDRGRLVQRWYFGATPEARAAAALYRDRILRGASIGFVSDGLEDVSPEEAHRRYGVRKRLKRHVGGELVETSAVPVPSCPGALAEGWVDAPRAGAVVSRGMAGTTRVPELVLKGLRAALPPARQATPARTIPARRHPEPPMSATATKPAAKTPARAEKDLGTLDDAAGGGLMTAAPEEGATPDGPSHPDRISAGLIDGMKALIDDYEAGHCGDEEVLSKLRKLMKTHGAFAAGDEPGEEAAETPEEPADPVGEKGADEDDDDPADPDATPVLETKDDEEDEGDEDMKAVAVELVATKEKVSTLEAEVADLKAKLAALDATVAKTIDTLDIVTA